MDNLVRICRDSMQRRGSRHEKFKKERGPADSRLRWRHHARYRCRCDGGYRQEPGSWKTQHSGICRRNHEGTCVANRFCFFRYDVPRWNMQLPSSPKLTDPIRPSRLRLIETESQRQCAQAAENLISDLIWNIRSLKCSGPAVERQFHRLLYRYLHRQLSDSGLVS